MSSFGRRKFLQSMMVLSAVAAVPRLVFARAVDAFKSESVDAALNSLLEGEAAIPSDKIRLKIPDIAENGAAVPVTISTTLEDVTRIYLLIDNNPNPLSAVFEIGPRSVAEVSTRVKIGESSLARAIVRAGGKAYMAEKEVKVTIGGCGG